MKRQHIAVKVHIHLEGEFARGRSCHTWSEKRRLRERGQLRRLYLKVRSHKADHSDSLTLSEVKRCHRRTHTHIHNTLTGGRGMSQQNNPRNSPTSHSEKAQICKFNSQFASQTRATQSLVTVKTTIIYTIVVDRYGFSYNAEINVIRCKRDIQKIMK